jgi:hypothetical protein
MDKRIILSESEKNRILGMHKSAIKTETKIIGIVRGDVEYRKNER